MAAKIILAVCAQVLLVQSAFSACIGNGLGAGWGAAGWGGLGGCGGVASTGGGHVVASASAIPPVGVSVLSDNVYEGRLCAGGNLPFLGTVGIEGVLPTAGAGAVSYGCGNGNIGIAGEAGSIVTGITAPGSYGPGIGAIGGFGNGLGYGHGLGYGAGIGCGCGGLGGIGHGYGGIGYGLY